jgi:prolipoprotein diacylglyceryl transferase
VIAPASIPSPPAEWASFSIGPLTFHVYALVIVLGIVLAVWWTNKRLTARGGEPWIIIDIAVPAVIFGLLGARLYHVFTHPADYFGAGHEWWEVFAIWQGGNAIIGGLIGGAAAAWVVCRLRGIRFLSFADAVAPPLLAAQAIGRIGNWFNHELFGWPTDLPWGLEIPAPNAAIPVGLPADTLFHPTFLYEMLWNLVGVGLIVLLERVFRMRWGKTVALYFIWYGIGRMMIESIRVDYSEIIFGLRSNVFGALVLVLIGLVLFIVQLRRHRRDEVSIYADGHVWSEDLDATSSATETAATDSARPDADAEEESTTTDDQNEKAESN